MAMGASDPAFSAGRLEELQRENEELREQVRRLATHETVARGAISEAVHEKEATARMAHQVVVEERATRAAVEDQSSSLGWAVMLQILNFCLMLMILFGLFAWLPRELDHRVNASSTTVVAPTQPGTYVAPVR
jgi:hypothetical protein